jgi:hypothetical protein
MTLAVFLPMLWVAVATAQPAVPDEPVILVAPSEAPVAPANPTDPDPPSTRGPDAALGELPLFRGELFLLRMPSADPRTKETVLTDMGRDLGAVAPNALERAKLERARQAVACARGSSNPRIAAGTKETAQPISTSPRPDPAACVGVDLPSLQVPGPAVLSPGELRKLDDLLLKEGN